MSHPKLQIIKATVNN